jgi:hypothetical protein
MESRLRIRNFVLLVSCVLIPAFVYWVNWQPGNATNPMPVQNIQSLKPAQASQSLQIEPIISCAHITSIQKNNLTPIGNALECIFAEYSVLKYAKADKAGKLLGLDNELRHLVKEVHTLEPADLWHVLWDDKYKKLGLYNGEGLQYTGQLKDEAEGKPVAWTPLYKEVTIKLPAEQQEKYDQIEALLARIHAEYVALPMKPENAEKLFALDGELRRLVKEIKQTVLDLPAYKDDDLGLYEGNGQQYTGKLRDEADKLLPPYVPVSARTGKTVPVPGEKYTELKDAIELIYAEYTALTMKQDDAEKLVFLDRELKKRVVEVVEYYPFQLSQKFWDKKYEKIGLFVGHYSDQLDYSGKLMVEAHKVNPNSRYREQAFYAAIFGEMNGSGNWDNGQPDIKQLYSYLQEFPNSVNAPNVYRNLAYFYHGLYKYLRYKPGPDDDPYKAKEECYKSYVSERPMETQLLDAQKTGGDFYKKLIALTPQGRSRDYYMGELAALEKGENEERDAWCDISD